MSQEELNVALGVLSNSRWRYRTRLHFAFYVALYESEDKKVVVPPFNRVLQQSIERVEIQPDSQPLPLRKALSHRAATSVVERCESNVSPVFLARSPRVKA